MKTAEQMATEIVTALTHLVAAHEAVWHRGASQECWDAPRDEAIRVIAEALTRASGREPSS